MILILDNLAQETRSITKDWSSHSPLNPHLKNDLECKYCASYITSYIHLTLCIIGYSILLASSEINKTQDNDKKLI